MRTLYKKYPHIHGYSAASFPYFNRTGSVYMYVCIRKSTELCNVVQRFIRIQTYTEPLRLKYGRLATKYRWIYGYLSQCRTSCARYSWEWRDRRRSLKPSLVWQTTLQLMFLIYTFPFTSVAPYRITPSWRFERFSNLHFRLQEDIFLPPVWTLTI